MMLVEAAMVLPLVMLLTMGVIEYGWMIYNQQLVTNAARHGARVAVRPDATSAEVQNQVLAVMTQGRLAGRGYTLTCNPTDVAAAAAGDPVVVTVNQPYVNIRLLGIPLIPVPNNLSTVVTMLKEGP